MKKAQITAIVVVAIALVAGFWLYRRVFSDDGPVYRFATVERGDIESAVSATGKLSAVTTVQVGTQVSGKIVATYADFNDPVKEGQLIARIDPTILEQQVRDAEAGLERSRAELEQRQREYDRNRQLFEQKVLTEVEFNNAKYQLAVAQANVKSAEVALARARQNLEYTSIYAPIDGVVVERNVDVGQTVAASLSAPQLFLIANDLSQMQILASVDESDIGLIKEGQPVRFTVQAYPNDTFTGIVKQVRLQSTTTENVVNYTVVISVDNSDGRLLPGMTATVEFLTGSATDVLLVANAALRFRPTPEMIASVRERAQERMKQRKPDAEGAASGGSLPQGMSGPANGGSGPPGQFVARQNGEGRPPWANGSGPRAERNSAMLWYLDSAGKLAVMPVRTGITDGQRTEVSGPNLKEGMQVIIGVMQTNSASTPNSPFQPGGPGGGPRMRFGPGF